MFKRFLMLILSFTFLFTATACNGRNEDNSSSDTGHSESSDTGDSTSDDTSEEVLPVKEIVYTDMLSSKNINFFGRNYVNDSLGMVEFDYSAAGFEVEFTGTKLTATLYGKDKAGYGNTYLSVFTDGEEKVLELESNKQKDYVLCDGLTEGTHRVKVLKRTELAFTQAGIARIWSDGDILKAPARRKLKFEFYGDSITCGYGSVSEIGDKGFKTVTESALSTYAFFTAEHFNAECNFVSYSGWYVTKSVDGTEAGDISKVYDKYSDANKDEWNFSSYVADVVVVNIGANDENYVNLNFSDKNTKGERIEYFDLKYTALITNLRQKYPNAYIFCVTGMLGENTLPNTILSVAELKQLDGDNKIFATTLYARDNPSELGTDGHPSESAHRKAANDLIEMITDCVPAEVLNK